jgi:hypothetical protein
MQRRQPEFAPRRRWNSRPASAGGALRARDLLDRRERAVWIEGLLVLGLSLGYLALLPDYFNFFDEGTLADISERVQKGEMLHRDIWSYWNPGGFWLCAALFELFGASVQTLRVSLALFGSLAAVGVWRLARDHAGRILAMPAGLAAPMVCYPIWWMASPHWYSTFTAIAAALALRGCFGDRPSPWATLATGALCGVTYVVLQPVGALLSLAVGLVLVWDRLFTASPAAALRTASVLGLGALGPTLAMYAWFAAHGLLARMWNDTILWSLNHFGPNWKVAYGSGIPLPTAPPFRIVHVMLTIAPPLGYAAAAALTARPYLERRAGIRDRRLLALAGVGAGLLASNYYYPDVVHLAFGAPPAFALLAALASRLPGVRGGRALGRVAPALLLAFVATAGAGAVERQRARGGTRLATPRGEIMTDRGTFEHFSAVFGFLSEQLRPGDEFYVYPYGPGYNFLAGRPNPTPYPMVYPGDPSISTPEQLAEVARALERKRVRFVLVGGLYPDGLEKLDTSLERYIRSHYRPAHELPRARLWERLTR